MTAQPWTHRVAALALLTAVALAGCGSETATVAGGSILANDASAECTVVETSDGVIDTSGTGD